MAINGLPNSGLKSGFAGRWTWTLSETMFNCREHAELKYSQLLNVRFTYCGSVHWKVYTIQKICC